MDRGDGTARGSQFGRRRTSEGPRPASPARVCAFLASVTSSPRPGDRRAKNFLSTAIRRPWPIFFFSPRSARNSSRQFSPPPPTGLSTAPNNARESHQKSISIHSQFMLNPQAVHDLASGLDTLYVATFDGGAPKSSAVFLAPYHRSGYKEAA